MRRAKYGGKLRRAIRESLEDSPHAAQPSVEAAAAALIKDAEDLNVKVAPSSAALIKDAEDLNIKVGPSSSAHVEPPPKDPPDAENAAASAAAAALIKDAEDLNVKVAPSSAALIKDAEDLNIEVAPSSSSISAPSPVAAGNGPVSRFRSFVKSLFYPYF